MILSYKDKNTAQFADGAFVKAFQGFEEQAARRLSILNAAPALDTLRALPGNRLESLKGDRAGVLDPHQRPMALMLRVAGRRARTRQR